MNKITKKLKALEKEKIQKIDYVSNWVFNNNVEIENVYDRSPLADRVRTELRNIRNINILSIALKETLKEDMKNKYEIT